eukprot:3935928-Rhodomonas_salina.1
MREAVLTVFPNTVYLRCLVPTTFPTTGPESNPTRTMTWPREGSFKSICVALAASRMPGRRHAASDSVPVHSACKEKKTMRHTEREASHAGHVVVALVLDQVGDAD